MIHTRSLTLNAQASADGKSITYSSHEFSITYTLPAKGYMVTMSATPLRRR